MVSYKIVSSIVGVCVSAAIFVLVRRDRLHVRYALWWILVALATAVFGLFPQLIDTIGKHLGIGYPPVLLFVIGLPFILIKMLTMDIEQTRQEQKIRRLVQELAILKGELGYRSPSHSKSSPEMDD